MIIYMFSTLGAYESENGLFLMQEFKVEEKSKIYVGSGHRILKDDINKIKDFHVFRMYRIDNDAKPYIEAVIKAKTGRIEQMKERLKIAEREVDKWRTLQRKDGGE